MKPIKIAIQGIKGSFHHQAAAQFYDADIELVECLSFPEIPEQLEAAKADTAVMAIENSIAGSILPNYALIDEYNLQITGEIHLDIHQNLMGLKGQNINDITRVYSHPMAILQCRKFFKKYPHISLIEDTDTAEVAKRIKDNHLKGVGAIASKMAANLYDLEIITAEIQTINNNATRFFILNKQADNTIEHSAINKASLKFILNHNTGALSDLLHVLATYGINLSKIQSLPIIHKPWEYAFFVDLIFKDYQQYLKAINAIKPLVISIKILGEYQQNR